MILSNTLCLPKIVADMCKPAVFGILLSATSSKMELLSINLMSYSIVRYNTHFYYVILPICCHVSIRMPAWQQRSNYADVAYCHVILHGKCHKNILFTQHTPPTYQSTKNMAVLFCVLLEIYAIIYACIRI